MIIKEHDSGQIERLILIGMITSTSVVGRISSRYTRDLFSGDWANLISDWCVRHYRRYDEAPNKSIVALFRQWSSSSQRDESSVELISDFLSSLSSEYESSDSINTQHLLDLAGRHFTRVKIERLQQQLRELTEADLVDEAHELVSSYRRVDVGSRSAIDVFNDRDAVMGAFSKESVEPLVEYHGDLGRFFGNQLRRNALVGFLAPEKGGKSHWLLDVAYRAALARKKTAFFSIGDMSESEVIIRLSCRNSKRPSQSRDGKWPCEVKLPIEILPPESGSGSIASVNYDTMLFEEPLDGAQAWALLDRTAREQVRSSRSHFRLSCHPAGSITVEDIESLLSDWQAQDWLADVVVIDYADLISPPSGKMDIRHQINKVWESLSALRARHNILVVTATQANRESYDQFLLSRRNVSEDKRKHAHVTAMAAINMDDREREAGLCRLNWLDVRSAAFSTRRVVHVAGCFDIAHPSILGAFSVASAGAAPDEELERSSEQSRQRRRGAGANGAKKRIRVAPDDDQGANVRSGA